MSFKQIPKNHYIFPLAAGSKVPLSGSTGFHEALPLEEAIKTWPYISSGVEATKAIISLKLGDRLDCFPTPLTKEKAR